jgi:hypothetical protein
VHVLVCMDVFKLSWETIFLFFFFLHLYNCVLQVRPYVLEFQIWTFQPILGLPTFLYFEAIYMNLLILAPCYFLYHLLVILKLSMGLSLFCCSIIIFFIW